MESTKNGGGLRDWYPNDKRNELEHQGGILFEAAQLRPLDEVQLSFRLPAAGVTVQATGVVVRVDEQQRIGVRFVKMNDAGRDGIRKLVNQEQ